MPNQNQPNNTAGKVLSLLRRIFTLNIGTVLFGVLFLYMIFSAIVYQTNTHYTSYQVISGPLSRNETYTGLAIREESTVASELSGYVSYYAREGTKINANGPVYGISPTKSAMAVQPLGQEDLAKIRQQMSNFSHGFSMSHFNDTYSFKYELEGNILQYSGANALPESSVPKEEAEPSTEEAQGTETPTPIPTQAPVPADTIAGQTISRAPNDGIVLYYKDGYEQKTGETLTAEDFDQNSYQKTDLKTQEQVQAGQELYTIITDERWSLYIPLSKRQAARLADKESIRVKFLKDGISQSGDFSMVEIDGGTYGKIDFSKGLIRYASDRFLDIELVTNVISGLKIPLSSIASKDFYQVPKEYATYGGGGNAKGFLRRKKGENEAKFITPAIFGEDEEFYYVEKSDLQEGDELILEDSAQYYKVEATAALEGVFCINQGYPVFRQISILDQNEEFAIVEKNSAYGLARYDYIVRDASKVDEKDLIK